MRWLIAAALIVQLAGPVQADDELQHTREVVARHAAGARRVRIVAGVATTASGIALGVSGYYMATHTREGGFVDLSGLERGVGYTLLGVGGVLAITGPVLLLMRTDHERLLDELSDARDQQFARTEIASRAASNRRTRMMLRGMGGLLAGVGAVSTTIALVGGDSIDRNTHNELLGMGLGIGVWGAGFVVASLFETRWEKMHGELQQPRVPFTAGLVPVRGGAVAGISGTF